MGAGVAARWYATQYISSVRAKARCRNESKTQIVAVYGSYANGNALSIEKASATRDVHR